MQAKSFEPHKYQEQAIQFLIERNYAGLFLAPGLGKTAITLAAYKILKQAGFVKKLLVIAPLRPCYSVWPNEVAKWSDFSRFSIGILHGPKKLNVLNEQHDIYVINPEGLKWLFKTLRQNMPFEMLVLDESSRFKHTNTDRFKTLKPHLPKFRRRVILTGSPAPNGLMDLFGQIFCMDLGRSLSPYITHFRAKFFDKRTFEIPHPDPEKAIQGLTIKINEWTCPPDKAANLYEHIAPNVLRMSAKDYLKMPKLIFNDIYIDLPPEAMALYKQFEGQLRLDFKAGKVTAKNVAIRGMKCRQIANGGIYLDEEPEEKKRKWNTIHNVKAEVVAELVEELSGSPALIAYEFLHDLERLKKHLGPETPYIGGGVSVKAGQIIVDGWNAGHYPAVLGQPQTMARGLNLQDSGDTVIWHSLIFNFEDYDQFNQRVYRQGKDRPVTVHRIIARDTVDEIVAAALNRKDCTQNALFDAIKSYWCR